MHRCIHVHTCLTLCNISAKINPLAFLGGMSVDSAFAALAVNGRIEYSKYGSFCKFIGCGEDDAEALRGEFGCAGFTRAQFEAFELYGGEDDSVLQKQPPIGFKDVGGGWMQSNVTGVRYPK